MILYKILKRSRVVLSLLVMAGIAAYFSFVRAEAMGFLTPLLKLQFVPALLGVFAGALVSCVALLLLTLLFGRIYCSLLCPMGTLQDVSIRVAHLFKSKKNKQFRYSRSHSIVRYSILAIVAACWLVGFSLPLLALDPYSHFGRFSHHLFGPIVLWLNNRLSYIAPDTFYYVGTSTGPFLMYLSLGFLLFVILGLSAFRGRLFCNTICPVGSSIGLISKYSAFRLAVDKERCNHCGVCGKKCKAECIDTRDGSVDHSRCVACLNCTLACSQQAMRYTFSWRKKSKEESIAPFATDTKGGEERRRNARRAFLASTGGLVGAAALYRVAGGKLFACAHTKNPIAPPGALSYVHLKEYCTACQACVSVCPSRIIRPAFSGYGMDGIMLPHLDYSQGFCRYDCNLCSQVCPSQALKRSTIEEKKLIQMGKARFFLGRCVVNRDQTDCGACDEHCPTKAVHMEPRGDKGLRYPVVDQEYCIGCGACEYICPATPKAIVVQAQAIHQTALPPIVEEQEQIMVDDFGF